MAQNKDKQYQPTSDPTLLCSIATSIDSSAANLSGQRTGVTTASMMRLVKVSFISALLLSRYRASTWELIA